jgi:dTDP-4-dehydrorhamnose reductase
MRVLVTGGAGLLGQRLLTDAPPGAELHATWRTTPVPERLRQVEPHQVDLAHAEAVDALFDRLRPEVVVHTAYGVTDGQRDIVTATGCVAQACATVGADLVHLSSDMVFDGEHAPYAEDHPLLPVSVYGRWKAQAEAEVLAVLPDAAIVRTTLITWTDPLDPRTAWVADSLRQGGPITLFEDEIRCPVRLDDLAAQIWEIVGLEPADRSGPWHLVGPEALSRHDLGVAIADALGLDTAAITPGSSRDQREPRPRDLRLTTERNAALTTAARPVTTLFR